MSFGSRIKEARKRKSLTQERLGLMVGVAKSTVAGYEKGTSHPDDNRMIALMSALNVDANYLWQDEMMVLEKDPSAPLSPPAHRIGKAYEKATPPVKATVEVALKPFMDKPDKIPTVTYIQFAVSDQKAAAGNGIYLGPESFTVHMVDKSKLPHGAAFGVPISGDSMEPKFFEGDIAVISKEYPEVGQVGLFTLDGKGFIKELGEGELISLNPKYDPKPLSGDCISNGKIIGKISWDDVSEE